MMKFKKLNNVSEAHCREFQRRIRGLDKEVRPIIKILSKDVTERVRFENDALLDHFIKFQVFKHLKISTTDLLKGISMIDCVWLPRESVLFNYGDQGLNFYIVVSGKC